MLNRSASTPGWLDRRRTKRENPAIPVWVWDFAATCGREIPLVLLGGRQIPIQGN